MTKATITITDESDGALDVKLTYDPPLDPEAQPTPAQVLSQRFIEYINPPTPSYISKCRCTDCGKLYEDHEEFSLCGSNLICHVCGGDFGSCPCPAGDAMLPC